MGKLGNWIKGSGSYEVKEIAGVSEKGELVTNGDFSAWTDDDPDNWDVTEDANNYVTEDSEKVNIVSDGSGLVRIRQSLMTVGKYYLVSINITDVTSGTLYIGNFTSENYAYNSTGTKKFILRASNGYISIKSNLAVIDITFDNVSVQEVPEGYPLLDAGTKYLECTSDGTIALPSTQAYGTWEFDLYKNTDSDNIGVHFIDEGLQQYNEIGNYYWLRFDAAERLCFYHFDTVLDALFQSADAYLKIKTWYRFKVTRTKDGEFYVYVMGGDFGTNDWTQVVAGTGSNPVTNNDGTKSRYIFLDADSGCCIANIKVWNDVKQ